MYSDVNKIKERLCEELKNSGKTTIEIANLIGVSPEMITQYKTTKNSQNLIRSPNFVKYSIWMQITF